MKIHELKSLTEFLAAADGTTQRLTAGSTPGLRLVLEVDELIRHGVWGTDVQLDPVSAVLAINSYYSFLAAVRVALSGQPVATFPLIRHSLECACYAYLMADDERLASIWLNRHGSDGQLKACRDAFRGAVSRVASSIRGRQAQLGDLVDELYETTIDHGAHPNAKSMLVPLSMNEIVEGIQISLPCLFHEEDIRVQAGLVACAEAGIVSAFVIALAAKGHPLIDAEYSALEAILARVHETTDELHNQ